VILIESKQPYSNILLKNYLLSFFYLLSASETDEVLFIGHVCQSSFTIFPPNYYKNRPLWFVVGGTKALVCSTKMNVRFYVVQTAGV
jgi:hypothetical protein